MKIIYSETIGLFSSVLVFCLVFSFSIYNSIAIAADYDNFDGSEVDLSLWWIDGGGSEIENDSVLTLSDGFLHADVPADVFFVNLSSNAEFRGDVEFILDFRNFQPSAETGGPPALSLTLKGTNQDECARITLFYDGDFNQNSISSVYCNNPTTFITTISANSGLFRLTRFGSNITTSYDIGGGWVSFGTFSEVFTGDATIEIGFQTGSSGPTQVSSDFLSYEGQILSPTDSGSGSGPGPAPDINLSPPENLTSTVDETNVNFAWSAVSEAAGYRMYYGISPGNYVGFVDLNSVTSLAVTDVPEGNYYLAITAISDSSESDFSNEINVLIEQLIISAPENFVATVDEDTVYLSWTSVPSATSYELFYGVSSGEYLGSVSLDNSSLLTIPDVPNGTYFLTLVTHSGVMVSRFSEQLSIIVNVIGTEYASISKSVGPSGGILEFADGIVFDVPAGAVTQETTLTVQMLNVSEVDPIFATTPYASHEKKALAAFSAEPSGLVFNAPVTVSVPVRPLEQFAGVVLAKPQLENEEYFLSDTDITYVPDEGRIYMQIQGFSTIVPTEVVYPPERSEGWSIQGVGSTVPRDDLCRTKRINVRAAFSDFNRSGSCQILSESIAVTLLDCPSSPTERFTMTEVTPECGDNFSLEINILPTTIAVGETKKLTADVIAHLSDTYSERVETDLILYWDTLASNVLRLLDSQGNAEGVQPGIQLVGASASLGSSFRDEEYIQVTPPVPKSMTIRSSPMELEVDQTAQLSADVTYTDNSVVEGDKNVTWTTSTSDKVKITTSGFITARAPGSANVTATIGNVSVKFSIPIKEKPALASPSVVIDSISCSGVPWVDMVVTATGRVAAPEDTGFWEMTISAFTWTFTGTAEVSSEWTNRFIGTSDWGIRRDSGEPELTNWTFTSHGLIGGGSEVNVRARLGGLGSGWIDAVAAVVCTSN